jgi:hypothetical protein
MLTGKGGFATEFRMPPSAASHIAVNCAGRRAAGVGGGSGSGDGGRGRNRRWGRNGIGTEPSLRRAARGGIGASAVPSPRWAARGRQRRCYGDSAGAGAAPGEVTATAAARGAGIGAARCRHCAGAARGRHRRQRGAVTAPGGARPESAPVQGRRSREAPTFLRTICTYNAARRFFRSMASRSLSSRSTILFLTCTALPSPLLGARLDALCADGESCDDVPVEWPDLRCWQP